MADKISYIKYKGQTFIELDNNRRLWLSVGVLNWDHKSFNNMMANELVGKDYSLSTDINVKKYQESYTTTIQAGTVWRLTKTDSSDYPYYISDNTGISYWLSIDDFANLFSLSPNAAKLFGL